MTAVPAVELRDLSKSFPGTLALDRVTMAVAAGEVHALLGENGAGKSTLIKIVTGAYSADRGTVRIGDRPLEHATPRAAQALGVRVIHQERQIASDLSVAENLLLDQVPVGRLGLVSRRRTERVAAERLGRLGVDLDPAAPARMLGVAQQQLLELCRAVSFDVRVVIMDEPTASLHHIEKENLFGIVRRLRDHGVAVLFISHHLDEVFAVADRVTVLRDGRVAGSSAVADTQPDELIPLIFGKSVHVDRADVRSGHGQAPTPAPDVVVSAEAVSYRHAVRSVDLDVRAGEIVALTGVLGSGASELAQLLAGCLVPTGGAVRHGTDGRTFGSRTEHARQGVAYLPADRKRHGLLLEQSVCDNVLLSRLVLRGEPVTRFGRDRRRAAGAVRRLSIKTRDIQTPVRLLSGGNQQKCILARWLEMGSRLFVFDEPTAGVDISSKLELYHLLLDAAAGGAAVVLVSSDYEEIGAVADRVVVMRGGRIVGEVGGDDAAASNLVRMEIGA